MRLWLIFFFVLKKKMSGDEKPLMGRQEWFAMTDLGIHWMTGKVNSGARESELHALDIEKFENEGEEWVRFRSVDDVIIESPLILEKMVKDSSGVASPRYFVEVEVETLDDETREVLVGLTDRSQMRCLLVLGRRALEDVYIDCSRRYLLGKFYG